MMISILVSPFDEDIEILPVSDRIVFPRGEGVDLGLGDEVGAALLLVELAEDIAQRGQIVNPLDDSRGLVQRNHFLQQFSRNG